MASQPKININISDRDQTRLDGFKMDIASDADAMDDQREKANEDARFVNVDGGQWEGWYESTFDFPDRVKLELDIVSSPLQRFIGEWSLNRVGVDFKPNDAGTSQEDSDLINGIYRSDFRDHSGSMATDQAVIECATVGFGAFKMSTQWEDEGDPENENQHIAWAPIHNAYNCVIWDQSALRIDKRDANHCTVLHQYTRKGWERAWPDRDVASAYTPEIHTHFGGTLTSGNSSDIEIFYAATRYEVVKKKTPMFVYNNLLSEKIEAYTKAQHEEIKDELAADETRVFSRERVVTHQTCEKTVFSGTEILEKTRTIAGKYIPIVCLYGYRSWVDGTERYRGIVRKMKDPQRLFNVQVSEITEEAAAGESNQPIFFREQMQSDDVVEAWANKKNAAFLVVDKALDDDGSVIATGPIGYNQPAPVNPNAAALIQVATEHVQQATGFSVGEAIDKEASGKAIRALMKREDMGTQTITSNIEKAIEWSGEIYASMAQEVYTTARMVKTLDKQGQDGTANLMEPIMDETGSWTAANNLNGRKFQSYADTGPSYDTVREQTVEDLKGMADLFVSMGDAGAEYLPLIVGAMLENVSGTNMDALQKFNREKMLKAGHLEPVSDEDKEYLAKAAKTNQPEPEQAYLAAETQRATSEARNLDSASAEKVANAQLIQAKTAQVMTDVQLDSEASKREQVKLYADIRQKAREGLAKLPIGGRRQ